MNTPPLGSHKKQSTRNHYVLVGGLEHLEYLSIQLGISSSQLTHIFQRGLVNHQLVLVDEIALKKCSSCDWFNEFNPICHHLKNPP